MSSYYTIQLLNDLHNYFPDILYGDVNRFPTVESVLTYIRREARTRHDLYSTARRTHVAQRANEDRITLSFNLDQPRQAPVPAPSIPVYTSEEDIQNSLSSILNMFYTMPIPRNNFMEPVVVRPSIQQINANSSIVETLNTTDNCAICQDTMIVSQQIRQINHCSHMFHNACISTWFQRNVHCPTCRHDIRTP